MATDGKKLAYSCFIFPKSGSVTVPIQVYDPASKTESDLRCLSVDPKNGSLPLRFGVNADGVTMAMSFTSGQEEDVLYYRFSDDSLTNLSQRKGGVWLPHIQSSLAVWTQAMWKYGESGYSQIMLHDTASGRSRLLAPHAGNQYFARIQGDRVVWIDNRNSPGSHIDQKNSDIYMHDLTTGKTRAVSTHQARQDLPDVEGDLVVWEDWRNNPNTITPRYGSEFRNSDVYLKDMKSGQEFQLTSFANKGFDDVETKPRIDGRRVFFSGVSLESGIAVFMIDLDQALDK